MAIPMPLPSKKPAPKVNPFMRQSAPSAVPVKAPAAPPKANPFMRAKGPTAAPAPAPKPQGKVNPFVKKKPVTAPGDQQGKGKTVTAPVEYQPTAGAPREHLAYLSRAEMRAILKLTGGKPVKTKYGLLSFYMDDTDRSGGSGSSGDSSFGGDARDTGGYGDNGHGSSSSGGDSSSSHDFGGDARDTGGYGDNGHGSSSEHSGSNSGDNTGNSSFGGDARDTANYGDNGHGVSGNAGQGGWQGGGVSHPMGGDARDTGNYGQNNSTGASDQTPTQTGNNSSEIGKNSLGTYRAPQREDNLSYYNDLNDQRMAYAKPVGPVATGDTAYSDPSLDPNSPKTRTANSGLNGDNYGEAYQGEPYSMDPYGAGMLKDNYPGANKSQARIGNNYYDDLASPPANSDIGTQTGTLAGNYDGTPESYADPSDPATNDATGVNRYSDRMADAYRNNMPAPAGGGGVQTASAARASYPNANYDQDFNGPYVNGPTAPPATTRVATAADYANYRSPPGQQPASSYYTAGAGQNGQMMDQYYGGLARQGGERVVSVEPVGATPTPAGYSGSRGFTARGTPPTGTPPVKTAAAGQSVSPIDDYRAPPGTAQPTQVASTSTATPPATGSSTSPVYGGPGVSPQPNTLRGTIDGTTTRVAQNIVNNSTPGKIYNAVTGRNIAENQAPSQSGIGLGGGGNSPSQGGGYQGGPTHPGEGGGPGAPKPIVASGSNGNRPLAVMSRMPDISRRTYELNDLTLEQQKAYAQLKDQFQQRGITYTVQDYLNDQRAEAKRKIA